MPIQSLWILRALGRVIRWAVLTSLIIGLTEAIRFQMNFTVNSDTVMFLFFVAGASAILILGLWSATFPIRRFFLRCFSVMLIRSGVRGLVSIGTWELLSCGVIGKPFSPPDYSGIETLHRAYDSLDEEKQRMVLDTCRDLAEVPRCNVVREVTMFEDVIGTSA